MNDQEIWRDVLGFVGYYQVSNHGRVRSTHNANQKKILAPGRSGRGYLKVNLKAKPNIVQAYIHQLVAWAFLGDQPEGTHVHHIDGDMLNNRSDNLAYVKIAEHIGAHHRGEKNQRALLTADDVLEIRARYANGEMLKAIAPEYGVSKECASSIVTRRSWKHI